MAQTSRRLLLVMLVALAGGGLSWARVSISPAYVDVTLEDGRAAGKFRVANLGDEEERYRMTARHFTFSKDGNLLLVEPDELSSVSWITFNPREFVLPPKTERTVRFAVVRHGEIAPGEYWASIELESLVARDTAVRQGATTMNLKVVPAILVPVFSRVGEIHNDGALLDVRLTREDDRPILEATVENRGNGRLSVRGEYTILDASGEVVATGPLGMGYVLRKLERRFSVSLEADLIASDCKIIVRFTTGQLDHDLEYQFKPFEALAAGSTE